MNTLQKPIVLIFVGLLIVSCGKVAPMPLVIETAVPSLLSPTPLPIPVITTPSPMPTQLVIPMITPDEIQVERWQEYEDALAKALFPSSFIPGKFLCEWEILGQSDQEVYVWTVCMSTFLVGISGLYYRAAMPTTIHILADGGVQSVEVPGAGSSYADDIRRMFPSDAENKYFDKLIHFQELTDHLNWRREHPQEPPLIVLSVTPIP